MFKANIYNTKAAEWQSGYAADCKSVYAGSIPTSASTKENYLKVYPGKFAIIFDFMLKKVVVSGGFDPLHIGHIRMFQEAKKLGKHLTVILNSDDFLEKKKGFKFMSFRERKEIISSLECVDKVVKSIDKDHTVCSTIKSLLKSNEIHIFANGGDRRNINQIPEYEICKENNIKMVFDVGGGKIQSSSSLTKPFKNYLELRPWGYFENLYSSKNYLLKKLVVNSGEKISLQYHNNRKENWLIVEGTAKIEIGKKTIKAKVGSSFEINKRESHRIENIGKKDLVVIELQSGKKLAEEDIVRIKDAYGRI